jgi:hypothetical protein
LLTSQAQGSIHMALAQFLPNHSVCVSNAAISPEWKNAISPILS